MKRTIQFTLCIFAAVILLSCAATLSFAHGGIKRGAADHGFSVKEYEDFHHVLHPLQHEALPKNDFKQIRLKASELVTLGEAITKLGIPSGVEEKSREEFKVNLGSFGDALAKFKADASSGADDQLKESYLAVHDYFEMLAALLPEK
ncbi:MAG: hypothetical protein M3447_01975 [Acidobacteriota bacterium]|nr:hypothetical protein [Acidobacteriota bacterium]